VSRLDAIFSAICLTHTHRNRLSFALFDLQKNGAYNGFVKLLGLSATGYAIMRQRLKLDWSVVKRSSAELDKRQNQGKLKVSVALSSTASSIELELGEMLLDTLLNLGFLPTLVRDGSRDVLDVDVLLLVGDCPQFKGYANLFSHWKERRPNTILWQIHSLPPSTLSTRAEYKGLRAVEINRVGLPLGWFSELIKSAIPVPVRAHVRRAIRAPFFFYFRKELTKSLHPALNELDANSSRMMMHRYAWLKHHFTEGWIDFVFVSSVPRKEFLTSRGIPAKFAPIGYHVGMGTNLGIKRDIDVLFIGGVKNRRRAAVLDTIRQSLTLKGIRLVTIERECYGSQRTELLNRACITLNLVNYPWDLPGIRFLMSMGCSALVVSEPLDDATPYKVGKHFVQASIADLPNVLCHYIEHEDERDAIVGAASNLVSRELTLEKTIVQMLGACDEDFPVPAEDISRGN
jgi:hypothetical protein